MSFIRPELEPYFTDPLQERVRLCKRVDCFMECAGIPSLEP